MSLETAKQIKEQGITNTYCDGKYHWERNRIDIKAKRIGRCDCQNRKAE